MVHSHAGGIIGSARQWPWLCIAQLLVLTVSLTTASFLRMCSADSQSGGGSDFAMAMADSVTKPLISMYETLEEDWEWESGQKASRGQKRRTLLQTASAQAWDLSAIR